MRAMKSWKEIVERLIWKVTSGRFIMTIIVGIVYAYLACNSILKEDRIMEITLIVLYAYFSRTRTNGNGNGNENESENGDESGKK